MTNEASPAAINIQWYVVTFGSGVTVQRGETTQSLTSKNVAITAVGALTRAFVLWSKTAVNTDLGWDADDPVIGELTTTTNLQFRSTTANAGHIIAWQVVEFTNAADINVQKGNTTLTGATLTTNVTLGTAVNLAKTFVLVGAQTTNGTGPDIGAKLVRARLVNSTTLTIDRAAGTTSDVTQVTYQVVELKDNSRVWSGNANFAAGVSQTTGLMGNPLVNLQRAVAFISTQNGGGQNGGSSAYIGDDIVGVSAVTASITAQDTVTLTRDNTVAAADAAWFVVQFDGGSPFKVGSFTASTAAAPASQTIAHGLGQIPKALLFWTEGRTDTTFSTGAATVIAARATATASGVANVTSVAVAKPTGTLQGDVMIALGRAARESGEQQREPSVRNYFHRSGGLDARSPNGPKHPELGLAGHLLQGRRTGRTRHLYVVVQCVGRLVDSHHELLRRGQQQSHRRERGPGDQQRAQSRRTAGHDDHRQGRRHGDVQLLEQRVVDAADRHDRTERPCERRGGHERRHARSDLPSAGDRRDRRHVHGERVRLTPTSAPPRRWRSVRRSRRNFAWGVTDGTTSRSISADSRHGGTFTAAATRIAQQGADDRQVGRVGHADRDWPKQTSCPGTPPTSS